MLTAHQTIAVRKYLKQTISFCLTASKLFVNNCELNLGGVISEKIK